MIIVYILIIILMIIVLIASSFVFYKKIKKQNIIRNEKDSLVMLNSFYNSRHFNELLSNRSDYVLSNYEISFENIEYFLSIFNLEEYSYELLVKKLDNIVLDFLNEKYTLEEMLNFLDSYVFLVEANNSYLTEKSKEIENNQFESSLFNFEEINEQQQTTQEFIGGITEEKVSLNPIESLDYNYSSSELGFLNNDLEYSDKINNDEEYNKEYEIEEEKYSGSKAVALHINNDINKNLEEIELDKLSDREILNDLKNFLNLN